MSVTYFSCGSVHYFLEGKYLMRTNTFSRYWLETEIVFGIKCRCGRHIFMGISPFFFYGEHYKSKFCDVNFSYSFQNNDFKLYTCVRHEMKMWSTYFHVDHSIIISRGARFHKIFWREPLLQFWRYWLETLNICLTLSVHLHDIFFMRINPSLLGWEQDWTILRVSFVINLAFSTFTKEILTTTFYCLKIQSFLNISFTGCSVMTFDQTDNLVAVWKYPC
jgi:hypothetical protein